MTLSLLAGKRLPGHRPSPHEPSEMEELRALLKALTEAATSFGSANSKAILELAADKRVAEVQERLDAEVARREAAERELTQAKAQTDAVRSELAAVSAAADSARASLADMERATSRISAEAETQALNNEARMRDALAQLDQARKDIMAERTARGQAVSEVNAARMDVERLRAQLLATPAPHQFQVDVLRDKRGLIRAINILSGDQRIVVDVVRNAVGKIMELKRSLN